jgi:hypothetical protein
MDRRPIVFRVLEAWLSRRITRIEMLELLAMIREDLEARDEARDALDAAEEELDLAYDVAEDTLLEAREAATRARVRPLLYTDDDAQGDIILRELREMGYPKAELVSAANFVVTESIVSYGAAPDWVISELAGVVRVHQATQPIPCSKRYEDDDWDVVVEVLTSIDEDESDAPFEGLGSLFI